MSFLKILLGLKNRTDEEDRTQTEQAGVKAGEHERDAINTMLTFIKGMVESLATERIEFLTLREAITRFVEVKPERPYPVRGALIAQSHREGKLVVWAFLDRDNNMILDDSGAPLGRKAICAQLDEELTAMLDGRELLIVE
jgi:hypothetical protein